jgi:hypothetical protein
MYCQSPDGDVSSNVAEIVGGVSRTLQYCLVYPPLQKPSHRKKLGAIGNLPISLLS